MKLWKCYNPSCCDKPGVPGHDFAAELPVCDACGTDARVPRFANLIVRRVVIHFEPPSHVEGMGAGHLACQPKADPQKYRRTGSAIDVNCPVCVATDAWRQAEKVAQMSPDHDVPLSADL